MPFLIQDFRYFMQAKSLTHIVVNALEDLKGQDIIDLDVHKLTVITDHMIMCSGTSSRQT